MAKALLTDRFIERHAFAPTDKPIVLRDTKTPGLLLRVGRMTKKLIFQCQQNGKTVYRPLGDWDGTSVTIDSARRKAGAFAQTIREGDKLSARREAPTVKQAFDEYIETRNEGWAKVVQGFYDRHFAPMANRKLFTLSGATKEMVALHNKITDAGHPFEANRALQALRAVYRRAQQFDDSLPAKNPVHAFGMLDQWNPEPPAKKAIAFEDLAAWGRKVDAIEKDTPIRAAFHRLCLLTGARPEELRRLRWENIDWKRKRFTFADTKGGKGKARKRMPGGLDVTVPMTAAIIKQFKLAKAEGETLYPESPWVFPAASASGHLMEWSQKTLTSKEVGNFGRHQYQAIGRALGIHPDAMNMLTGHIPPKGNVGANYGQSEHDIEQVKRPAQEKLSKRITQLLNAKPKTNSHRQN